MMDFLNIQKIHLISIYEIRIQARLSGPVSEMAYPN